MKAFIESQFGYCPLVWMFHSRSLNNKINRIHERALKIAYNGKSSSFQNLLEKKNSVTIHHRNIKILATETYKFLQGLSLTLINEIFVERNNSHSLRGNNVLARRRVNSVRCGTEAISFLSPKIWDIWPKDIKDSKSLDIFKRKIKWLCKTYVPQVGFIWVAKLKDTYHLLKLKSIRFSIIVKMLV